MSHDRLIVIVVDKCFGRCHSRLSLYPVLLIMHNYLPHKLLIKISICFGPQTIFPNFIGPHVFDTRLITEIIID